MTAIQPSVQMEGFCKQKSCVCMKKSNLILFTECQFCSYTHQLFFFLSSAFTSLYALSDCPQEKTRLLKMKWNSFRIEKVIFTVLFSRVKEQTILTVVEKCFYPKLPRSNKLLNRNIGHKAIILTSPLEITPSPKSRADEGGRKFRLRLTQFPKNQTDDENRVPLLNISLTSADEGTSKARKMQDNSCFQRNIQCFESKNAMSRHSGQYMTMATHRW